MAVTITESPATLPLLTPHAPDPVCDPDYMETPAHPVVSMQGAFEESILESTEEHEMPPAPVEVDAGARRHRILESKTYDDSWIARWNQRPTAKYHPLLKLMAQIVFGMHLLQQHQAKSDKEVVNILQTHVNEVDTFLERTAEDFAVAIRDAEDRIRCLKLPITHLDVFQTMLGDKRFRSQLLTGNEKIEKIIERTQRAMDAYLLDIEVGVEATRELHRFMKKVQDTWPQEQRSIADVYSAMRGNEQGWKRYLKDLQHKGTVLGGLLASLQKLITDMSKMAADATARSKAANTSPANVPEHGTTADTHAIRSAPTSATTTTSTIMTSSPSPHRRPSNMNKGLPRQPITTTSTAPASDPTTTTSKVYAGSLADRYDRPIQPPAQPSAPTSTSAPSILHPRPKTATDPRAAGPRSANALSNPTELPEILQRPDPLRSNPNPLRSNPPANPLRSNPPENPLRSHPVNESDIISPPSRKSNDTSKLSHSTSANLIMGTVSPDGGTKVTRSVDVTSSVSTKSIDLTRTESRGLQSSGGNSARNNSSSTTSTSAAAAAEHAERRAAMKDTGFARRLSKRLKHLPTDVDSLPQSPPLPGITVTSASTTLRRPSPPEVSSYASFARNAAASSTPSLSQSPNHYLPTSGLGPLPFENQTSYPVRTAKPEQTHGNRADSLKSAGGTTLGGTTLGGGGKKMHFLTSEFGSAGGMAGGKGEVKSITPSNKSKSSGFRSLWRSKWKGAKGTVVA